MKVFLATLSAFLIVTPAFAKTLYLVQQPGDPNATRILDVVPVPDNAAGNQPGANCPYQSFGGVWTQVNGDQYPGDYVWDSGSDAFIYSPPAPIVMIIPNPTQAKQLIQVDANIPGSAQVALLPYVSIINDYPTNAAGSKSAWSAMVQAFGSTWLTPTVQAAIEADCATANMPLN